MRREKLVLSRRARRLCAALVCLAVSACAGVEKSKTGNGSGTLITTPASYYSTPKARMLGQRYQANLDRIIERVARNPKTSGLQFSNNIASVGGIGFFTHAAASVPDERYLEVVLSAPELFDASDDSTQKLRRLFSLYGNELLAILAADAEIYQDRDVGGYGLNLSWRRLSGEGKSSRMVIERGVAYFAKSHVRGYLRREISENDLLKNAVVFVAENDRPMTVVSIQPQELRTDFRPPIVEENIVEKPVALSDVGPNMPVVKQPEPQIPRMPIAQPALQDGAPPSAPLIVVVAPETSQKTLAPDTSSNAAKPSSVKQPEFEPQRPLPEKTLPVNERPNMPVVKQPEPQTPPMPIAQPALQDSSPPSAPLIVVVAPETSQKTVAPDVSSNAATSSSVKQPEIEPQMPPAEKILPVNERPSAPLIVVLESPKPIAIPSVPAVVSKVTPDSSQETTSKVALQRGSVAEIPSQSAAAGARKQSDVVAQQKTPADLPKPIVRREETPRPAERSTDTTPTRRVEQPPAEYASRAEKSTAEVASQRTNNSAISTSAEAVVPKTPPQEAPSEPIVPTSVQPAESLPVVAPVPAAEAAKPETKPSSQEIVTRSKQEQAPRPVIPAPVIPAAVASPPAAAPIISLPEQQAVAMADTAKVQKDLPVNPVPAKQAALPANTTVQTTPLLSNESSTNAASEIFAAPQEIVQSESPVPVQPRKAEGEQLASLGSKPTEFVEPKKPAVRPVPKPLSGYIVQIAFADGGSAQRWAESMERRGFAVSVTDAGEAGGVRVRLGNFAARDQAERQLQMLRQEGLKGIVLNLPQAFRPEARASIP